MHWSCSFISFLHQHPQEILTQPRQSEYLEIGESLEIGEPSKTHGSYPMSFAWTEESHTLQT